MRWRNCIALVLLNLFVLMLCHESTAQNAPFVHQKRYAMGTVFEIVIYDDDSVRAEVAARAALDEVVRLDCVMSNYKPESDLSRMNRDAHFRPVSIPRELYDVIEQSLFYSRLSDGQFDISVGPVVDLWKAALAGGPLPTPEEQAKALRCVGYQKIELMPPSGIQFHSDCMRLDLGSIGKGYAVDREVDILKARGIRNAYLHGGGSTIYAMGKPPQGRAWPVHLRDPSNQLDPEVMLADKSVSTSEQSAPSPAPGEAPGHIVLPGTGKPLRTHYAVSVTAPTGTESDALSTTLLLLGPEKGAALVKKLHDVSAIWIDADGQRTLAGDGAKILVVGESSSNGATPVEGATSTPSAAKEARP
jgi:FAD:protein FMN transferase